MLDMLRVLLIVLSLGMSLPVLAEPTPVVTYEQGMTALESKDYPTALRIFRKVAATKDKKQKYRRAHYQLALMYLNGTGVKKDERAAYRQVGLAANYNGTISGDGFADAIYLQGTMIRDGVGVNRDLTAASIDFLVATKLGHKKAAYEAAILALRERSYVTESGQRHDRIYALRMLFIARMDNDERAFPVLLRHCKRLSSDEIAAAREDAQKYFKKDVRDKLVC